MADILVVSTLWAVWVVVLWTHVQVLCAPLCTSVHMLSCLSATTQERWATAPSCTAISQVSFLFLGCVFILCGQVWHGGSQQRWEDNLRDLILSAHGSRDPAWIPGWRQGLSAFWAVFSIPHTADPMPGELSFQSPPNTVCPPYPHSNFVELWISRDHGAKPVLCEVGSTEGKREAVRENVIKKSSAKMAFTTHCFCLNPVERKSYN